MSEDKSTAMKIKARKLSELADRASLIEVGLEHIFKYACEPDTVPNFSVSMSASCANGSGAAALLIEGHLAKNWMNILTQMQADLEEELKAIEGEFAQ